MKVHIVLNGQIVTVYRDDPVHDDRSKFRKMKK